MIQAALNPRPRFLDRAIAQLRKGPLEGRWLFAWVFLAQLGHLIEHISVAIQGKGLFGSQFDSELSHLLFNGAIAILSVVLVLVYPRNPWVYPLAVLSIFHGIEHVYIFNEFLKTGVSNGPGVLGLGGAIGVIALERLDLHNVYNGCEVILMTLGFTYDGDSWRREEAERSANNSRDSRDEGKWPRAERGASRRCPFGCEPLRRGRARP